MLANEIDPSHNQVLKTQFAGNYDIQSVDLPLGDSILVFGK